MLSGMCVVDTDASIQIRFIIASWPPQLKNVYVCSLFKIHLATQSLKFDIKRFAYCRWFCEDFRDETPTHTHTESERNPQSAKSVYEFTSWDLAGLKVACRIRVIFLASHWGKVGHRMGL